MARFGRLLIPILLLSAGLVHAEREKEGRERRPSSGEEVRDGRGDRSGRHSGKRSHSPEFNNVRRALEALTPEQRKRFEENFSRWANLPSEEKKSLRAREEWRRKRMAQEIDEAMQKAELELGPEERERFAKRYAEERRQLEEQLRTEMEEKRRPRIEEIVAKLKEEFAGQTTSGKQLPEAASRTP